MPQLVNSVVVQDDQPNVSANVNAGMLMNPIGTVPGIQPSRNPTWLNAGVYIASRVKPSEMDITLA